MEIIHKRTNHLCRTIEINFLRRFVILQESSLQQPKNYRRLFDDLSFKVDVRKWEDWYQIRESQLTKLGLKSLLQPFGDSLILALLSLYPEYDWKPWKFQHIHCPKVYWKKFENQKKFFEDLSNQLGIKELGISFLKNNLLDDWYDKEYKLGTTGHFIVNNYYENYLGKALKSFFPNHNWKFWKFHRVPDGFWLDKKNQIECLESLAIEFNIIEWTDWYFITKAMFEERGASGLVARYGGSQIQMLKSLYPQYPWDVEKFQGRPKNYWKNKENQRNLMDKIAKEIGIKTYQDWYQVSFEILCKHGASSVVNGYYGSSPAKAIISIYSEYPFQIWKFKQVYRRFWENDKNIKAYLEWLEKELNIEDTTEWLRVSVDTIRENGGSYLITKYGGFSPILHKFYPSLKSVDLKTVKHLAVKSQNKLLRELRGLFPEVVDILFNFPHPNMKLSMNRSMELDIFIPLYNLAFEYQGKQHYQEDNHLFSILEEQQRIDENKYQAAKEMGITLIRIPYWWDGSKEALIATIRSERKDLLKDFANEKQTPIQMNEPSSILQNSKKYEM